MIHDHINAAFELGGACLLCLNVVALLRDHALAGVHWLPTLWFSAWGFWNLFYYPALGQTWSFLAGAAVFAVNTAWLLLVFYFWLLI